MSFQDRACPIATSPVCYPPIAFDNVRDGAKRRIGLRCANHELTTPKP
jgi:hypothetical protein